MPVTTGAIDGSELGRTLTHEHFSLDYSKFLVEAPAGLGRFLDGEIHLGNVGFVQRYPYSNLSNISFNTEDTRKAVLRDVELFKTFGGGAIVENTNHGLKRNLPFLKEVSEKTGVHVVAGTGYYLAKVHATGVLGKSVEELATVIREELTVGCVDHPAVKCGFIGEVASDYPIHDFERKSIEATAVVQEELKCPASFHPGRDPKAPAEILRIFTEAGGDSRRAVMSHLDRTLPEVTQFLDLAAEYKCYLQQDLFGTEVLIYQFQPDYQMPSDAERIRTVKTLIANGHLDRILISHDVHTKHRLIEFGGHGYCHLYKNVIPKMLSENISQEAVDRITIENPRSWLSWNCP